MLSGTLLRAILHPTVSSLQLHATGTAAGGGEGGRCLQRRPKAVSGVLQMDPKQISSGLICLTAELSPTAKAAGPRLPGRVRSLAYPERAVSPLSRPTGRPTWDLSGTGAGWQDVLKECGEYEGLHSLTHTLPISFFMKTLTRYLISDRGSKFHARMYFTKHVLFRGRKTFN